MMKMEEVMKRVNNGEQLRVAKFMSCEAANRTMRDRESGKTRSFASIKSWFVAGGKPFQVVEYKEDDFKPEAYVCPFKEGQAVVVMVESMKNEKGLITVRGTVHPVDNN